MLLLLSKQSAMVLLLRMALCAQLQACDRYSPTTVLPPRVPLKKLVLISHVMRIQYPEYSLQLTLTLVTVQPYHQEIQRILTAYIIPDSPRELNLSGRERHAVLKALAYTTHPSAFRELANNVEYSLRRQAHPNFIRWAICNGNRPRVIFARGLGVFLIVAAIVTDILVTLSRVGRGWRVLSSDDWFKA